MVPQTRYARSGDVSIAYQVFGSGAVDVVLVPGWVSNVDVIWEEPSFVRFFQRLAAFSRVILFDKRGTGLSDRVTDSPTLEERMDDVRAVMEAVGSRRTALLGYSEGGPMCALFAATYPERTEALVSLGGFPRMQWASDWTHGRSADAQAQFLAAMRDHWGTPIGLEDRIPSLAADPRVRAWWAKLLRSGASPTGVCALMRANYDIDVRSILPSIKVPTLVVHASGDRVAAFESGRFMAEKIPGARLVRIDSDDHLFFLTRHQDVALNEIESFLTGGRGAVEEERVIKTIMFSDIVGSTEIAARLGDTRWKDLREAHLTLVRRELSVHRGVEVDTAGDGFYAVFDGPARAIKCARGIREEIRKLGVSVRIGLHTGECVVSDGKVAGLAVHIGSRVAGLAPADAVLVSQTVKDLVAGSGLEFADFGSHTLKGIPDAWRLYAVK